MELKGFVRRYPLGAYFTLAYGITWGGILLVAASMGFRLEAVGLGQIAFIFLAMLAGPSLSSLLLTYLLDGRAGWQTLFARIKGRRVGLRWYAIAVLTFPVTALVLFSALALFVSPGYRPGFVPIGLAFGLLAGFVEELGWTGFALPRLRARYNTFTAGLVLGVGWALWHIAADFSGNIHAMGPLWAANFFVYWVVPLTAYRILMVWVYENTESLLLAQLMHAAYTGSLALFSPPAVALAESLIWKLLLGLALWSMVTVIAVTYGKTLSRRALRAGA